MLAPRGEDVVYKVTFGGSQNDVKKELKKVSKKGPQRKTEKLEMGGVP